MNMNILNIKHILIKIWHYIPMLLILCMSTLTDISVERYLYNKPLNKQALEKHEPLYLMENVSFNNTSLSQNLSGYNIKAKQALQFEDDKNFLLKNIQIFRQKQEQNLFVQALSGTLDAKFEVLNLQQADIKAKTLNGNFILKSQEILFYP